MSDIVARLRETYVQQGANYVQGAADEIERLTRQNRELHARLEGAAIALAELGVEAARLAYWAHADVSERVALAEMPDAVERNALIDARRKRN